jgi:CTP synthase
VPHPKTVFHVKGPEGSVQTKYIFVTGGVTSSLGKGIFCASLGTLLQARGLRVAIQKFDPYINVDPGTMNPFEHGEVYVTTDGAETDLDLGHYERYLGHPTSQANNVTTGRVYLEVITKERAGAYLGKTVQVVPHVIDEIKHWMLKLGKSGEWDVVLTEIGGTVGDIESQPYLEAIRQLRWELGPGNTLSAHLTLVPYLAAAGELKTKPTQHSVKTLLSYGLQPDILVCRSEHPLARDVRHKIALFCNVESRAVVAAMDADSIYEVPLLLKEEGLDDLVIEKLRMLGGETPEHLEEEPKLSKWLEFLRRLKEPTETVRIALVGKYVTHQDAYKSITESFILAGAENGVKVDLKLVLSDDIRAGNVNEILGDVSGILVAPGFGERGIDGKLEAVRYARENDIPFFGICLGMQCAVIEFARNVCHWEGAHSTEFDPDTAHPVIDLMEEQKRIADKGGTMRLGSYNCFLLEGSRVREMYGESEVVERHRHRFEVNNVLRYKLLEHGMHFTGVNLARDLVEIVELPEKRWFIGVQFHPEYQSTVGKPHPLFKSFVEAATAYGARRNRAPQEKIRQLQAVGRD